MCIRDRSKTGDLEQDHVIYFETYIYPADYERYLAFTDANTLSQRVEAEGMSLIHIYAQDRWEALR